MSVKEILIPVIEGIVRVVKTSREAVAADLEEIATKVRGGALIADEAFQRAQHSVDRIREIKDRLPDE